MYLHERKDGFIMDGKIKVGKDIEVYDNDVVLDDGHDTPRELEMKHNKSLAQWRKDVEKIKAERDRKAKTGDEKPPIQKAKDEEITRGE